ncbi:MAG: hypothetical protein ABI603_01125 [Acidobacteriota bacterium]
MAYRYLDELEAIVRQVIPANEIQPLAAEVRRDGDAEIELRLAGRRQRLLGKLRIRFDFADLEDVPLGMGRDHEKPLVDILVAVDERAAAEILLRRLRGVEHRHAQRPPPA